MPNTKVTSLTDIASTPATNDVYPIVDVSDTSMAGTGTTKKIQAARILHTNGTANTLGATLNLNSNNLTSGAAASFTRVNTNSMHGVGLTVANLVVQPLSNFTSVTVGMLFASSEDIIWRFSYMQINGPGTALSIVADDLNGYSNVFNTANKINLYFSSGVCQVQNNTGRSQYIQIVGIGA